MTNKKELQFVETNEEYYQDIEKKFEEFNNNGRKTICYFCDTYYPILDGVIVVLNNYARLQSPNFNVVVCVPKHKGKATLSPDYLVLSAKSKYFKFVNYDLAFPNRDKRFNKCLSKLRIDLVHSHSPFTMGKVACKLAKERNVPLVCTFHSQYKQDFYKATKSRLLSNILLKGIMKKFHPATEVWTMNKECVRTLREYGYKGEVSLKPNATSKVRPDNIEELKRLADEKWNLKDEKNVFLFVGRLVTQKNILMIPESLKILKDSGIPFKMFYAGNGPDEEKLRKKIAELGLQEDIILLGRVENKDLDIIYARSTLMLFPSVYDTSSLTQIESATFDTPCLLIKGSVTAGTITDNVNGFLAENDSKLYAERIKEIVTNEELYEKVKANTYKDLYVSQSDLAKMVAERYNYLLSNKD